MSLSLPFSAFGVSAVVEVPDPDMYEILPTYLPPNWRHTTARPHISYVLRQWGDGRFSLQSGDRDYTYASAALVLDDLERLIRLDIAEAAAGYIFVHAGVVAWNGRAIVIPGESRAGKTTLVRALTAAGAEYYSDEYAVLDTCGQVHPYPSPLQLRSEGGFPQGRVSPEELRIEIGRHPVPVGLVALCTYRQGAVWCPQPLTSARAVLQLLDDTLPARTRPEQSLDVLIRATSGTCILAGTRGEAEETARSLLAALANA